MDEQHMHDLLQEVDRRTSDVEKLVKTMSQQLEEALAAAKNGDPYNSTNQDEIVAALARARAKFKPIVFDQENPYFATPYATLSVIHNAIVDALSEAGINYRQVTYNMEDGGVVLRTKVFHSSGQWFESRTRLTPPKNDLMTEESYTNKKRAMQLMQVFGISAENDPLDDDGEMAGIADRTIVAKGPSTKYKPKSQGTETITKEQLEELEYELSDYEDIAEEILDKLHIKSLADIPKKNYRATVTRVRKIKRMREGLEPYEDEQE